MIPPTAMGMWKHGWNIDVVLARYRLYVLGHAFPTTRREQASLSRKIKRLASKLKSAKALSAPASPMTTTTPSMVRGTCHYLPTTAAQCTCSMCCEELYINTTYQQ